MEHRQSIRSQPHTLQTKANYSVAPAGAPSDALALLVSQIRGDDNVKTGKAWRFAWVLITSSGVAELGAAGPLWLMRYSVSAGTWVKAAKLVIGTTDTVEVTAAIAWEDVVEDVLADSSGFDLWDEGGGALGSNVSLRMGWLT